MSLRISVTDRCQLRCSYCMPSEGVPKKKHSDILSFEEIVRFVQILKSGFGISKVHITGGEPLIRPGVVELIARLDHEGIADLALTTNGQKLAQMAGDLKRAGLHRVNISLDSLNDRTFRKLTGGGRLDLSVKGIEAAIDQGLTPVKINMVVLRDINDHEVTSLARFGLELGCRVRFLELMPIGCAKEMFDDLFVPAWEVRERLESCFNLKEITCQAGQSSRNFQASDRVGRKGIIGFISPTSQPFCQGCRKMRLRSTGQLISCLAKGCGPSIRNLLQNDRPTVTRTLLRLVAEEICRKRSDRRFHTLAPMVGVGG
ncbi:MAG: GTP 3',8-cyclase MoaA [Actinobacteria bacterium]|nr:GTP 3',8-cyclase MoaA [Actinomycetota bacterium]